MIPFLIRKFIPNHTDTASSAVRTAFGMLAGILGIVLNLLLCVGKLFAGMLTGSIAITADAVNNLSDAGSSVITLIGFKLASKKPDPDHPFGHGRVEYLAGLAVSLIILMMGFELLKSSVVKIFSPEPIVFQPVSAVILVVSTFVKLYMSAFNRTLGKKLDSPSMQATAADCRSDALATSVVFVTMLIAHFSGANIDGWAGLLVSFTIFWAGISAARETINPLLGQAPAPELVEEIREEVIANPNILGIHDLIVHDYGPGRRMVSLHAEVPADGDIMALHDAIDQLERHLGEEHSCPTVIHMDPIITNDQCVAPLRQKVIDSIRSEIDPDIQLHDFRIVTGPTHTNIIFDAVVPYNFRLTDEQLRNEIIHLIRSLDQSYYVAVTIDHQYT